jgi:hypothetical protein
MVLSFQGCTNRTITDYENCVLDGLTFELKDEIKVFVIDDLEGKNKYSSMNFPKGEYYLCIKKGMDCAIGYGEYSRGWSMIYLKSKTIRLTGRYKTNVPNAVLGAFAPDTFAFQVEIEDRKAWVSVNEFEDMSNFKESSAKNIQELNKNRKLTTDWNDWMTKFECPNPNVKEVDSEKIWFD